MVFSHRIAALAAVVAIPLGIAVTSYALTDSPDDRKVPPKVELPTAGTSADPSVPPPSPATADPSQPTPSSPQDETVQAPSPKDTPKQPPVDETVEPPPVKENPPGDDDNDDDGPGGDDGGDDAGDDG
ncbi:hypothetical protein ABT354_15135 [Streptomyces sp. NPDC000594]|uniref:hypothetical protein n=1 Tax=Streptomyces sp. NPDC000594 TaxID=3154261 RepID=UPI003332B5E5